MTTIAEPKSIIYGLFHKDHPDRIRYVGQTRIGFRRRLASHKHDAKLHPNYPRSRWMNKYGHECIDYVVIEKCDPERLNEREVFWISEYRSRGMADLNVASGGGIGYTKPGKPWTESTRRLQMLAKDRARTKMELGPFGCLVTELPGVYCYRMAESRNMCNMHYERMRLRNGNLSARERVIYYGCSAIDPDGSYCYRIERSKKTRLCGMHDRRRQRLATQTAC